LTTQRGPVLPECGFPVHCGKPVRYPAWTGVRFTAMTTAAPYLGWAITLVIALGGWIFTQALARGAARRNTQIDYLLDAYRRLERATSRPLTAETAQDIEAAVSDILLLGTASQAALAKEFGTTFAKDGAAEAVPLLISLRDSLRRETGLDKLPTHFSLRVSMGSNSMSDHARVWRETSQTTRATVDSELAFHAAPARHAFPAELTGLDQAISPSAAVTASYQQVVNAVRQLLAGATDDVSALDLAQLSNRALQLNLIDTRLADTLNGLSVMHLLAAADPGRLDRRHAAEFASLAAAALYVLDIASRQPRPA
jgi:hypothetical protein